MSSARRVTRHDVAVHAGVSDPVVSYTLNGGQPVAPATAARVLESVRLLGYTPNSAAQALKSGSANLVGIIVPDSTNPFYAQLCHAVEAAAAARGISTLVVNSLQDETTVEYLRALGSRQVDGVLVASPVADSLVAELDATRVRWAALNQALGSGWATGARIDLRDGGRVATEHLIAVHGHRRIAFVGHEPDGRFDGWSDALADAGLPRGPVFGSTFTRDGGYLAGRALSDAIDVVDAVFASSDMIASGMLLALHEAGVRLPDDLAIAAFDGSPESEFTWPTLTTVRQPIEELAARSLEQLLGDSPASEGGLLRGTLVVRRSCGCVT